MVKRLIIAVVLLGLIGGGLVGFNLFRDKMITDIFANMPVQPLPVSTTTATEGPWQPTINGIGTVNAGQGVDLSVEAAGIITEVLFTANSRVEQGDLLLRLDDVAQRSDLAVAQSQQELDTLNLERARELQSRGIGTSATLDANQAAARTSAAQVERAMALIEQRQLIAPFSGTIGLPRIDLGQYVQPGSIITTLQDLDDMRVDFSLPEQQLPDLFIGQKLTVRADGSPDSFAGEITGIDPRVNAASRMVAVRGSIANPGGQLTPGQFVRIRIDLPREEGVIALPQTAVVTSLYGDYVYAVRPREDDSEVLEARQIFVDPGRRVEGRVEVRRGVAAGDIVVTAGQNRLTNGGPVLLSNAEDPQPEPGTEATTEPTADAADTAGAAAQ
ncbi:efflux RND transporter periplasmic adaptor subunit [Roseicitreum antarcticum]|uniref:Membrane fusion protein, multidrug efflux system n=1 Tax=Roseicitreum antarcticum TaxID=564137 RepID=A0A1H2Z7A5_9RHOB|nr:efflux RND transporter periplasmic adaptor subunit [Roseicitreum antarcticum]SDX13197.1 membrane fusion protein, multidrug efflux system [Roseicitreum antarcticum]